MDIVKFRRWLFNKDNIAVLSFALSIIAAIVAVYAYFVNKEDDRLKRSVVEIDRLYDQQFLDSLTKIVDHYYNFMDNPKNNTLSHKERFNKFWGERNHDLEMFQITSRLDSVVQCLKAQHCAQNEIFDRFPATVYQAIFFLRDFVFFSDDLGKPEDTEGWWMGYDTYSFLARYCSAAKKTGMNLFSPKRERSRLPPDAPLPDPCLPPPRLMLSG
jgi:hypothetical protein